MSSNTMPIRNAINDISQRISDELSDADADVREALRLLDMAAKAMLRYQTARNRNVGS